MLYYDQYSVLIEIRKNNQTFITGDQEFSQIPSDLLNNIYTSANWNRALKYFSKELGQTIGYYMLKIDLYLDFESKELVVLTKNIFFKQIVNQTRFKEQFLQKVLDHKHRHRLISTLNTIIDYQFINKHTPSIYKDVLRISSINRFLINEPIDLDKYKFKDLFIISDKFDFKITNKNQRIYFIDYKKLSNYYELNKATFIDLVNHQVYLNTVLRWKNNIVLELKYDDFQNIEIAKNNLIEIFKTNFKTNLEWHLYNLSFDHKYLYDGLKKVFENNDFNKAIEILDNSFKELRLNYFVTIFKDHNLVVLIKKYVKNDREQQVFERLLTRYNSANIW
ncbi:hypothetical protein [Mycoplasma putrefaciens]|uniref:Uncharacterized protein n=1 Tax=Mycoplasma putrefaciens (strain ATCC 15718 / NCTC 10155 / C30 KS-1 / KS-1) TaxID=743965 RepID=A0A7U3ZS57_MYCPK|nr:hypothetical protein [Mycoplasma putrefaciens]AEM68523.1 uncharacterized protein MPUT_0119 [Mycoplasma putrefaciens KS1]